MAMKQDLDSEQSGSITNANDNTPLSPTNGPVEVKLTYEQVERREILLHWEITCLTKSPHFELIQVGKDNEKISPLYEGDKLEYKLSYKSPSLGKQYYYKVIVKGESLCHESNVVCVEVPPEIPSQPFAPKLQLSSKTTTFIRWNAVESNGAPVLAYHLEHSLQDSGDFELVYKGTERNIKLPFKLETAKSHKFRLRAENMVGLSQYSPALNYSSSPGKPTSPSPPYLTSDTSSSITVGWDEVASQQEDIGYILAMEDPSSGHGFIVIHNDKEAEFTKNDLSRISNYNFRLAIHNQYGTSPYSAVVTFSTAPDTPKQPHSLTPQSRPEYRSLHVTWSPPKDDGGDIVKAYSIEVAPLGRHYKRPYNIVCEENQIRIQDLRPGREYQIRIAARNSAGLGQYSNPVIFTTKIQKPDPPRLEGVDGVKAGLNTLRLEWDYPAFDGGGKITSYQLDVLQNQAWIAIYEDRCKNFTVKDLEPLTSYTFRVRCQNEAGYGQFTESFEATTIVGPPSTPSPPVLTSSLALTINVSWRPPLLQGVPITGYILQMQTFGSSKWRSVYEGANLTYLVKQNIIASTKYQFRICAKSSMGNNQWSELASISTGSGPPGLVQNVRVNKIKPASALVEWSPIESEEFPTESYLVLLNHAKLIEVHHPNSSYNVASLQPQTTYDVQIQAKNQMGIGPFSQVVTFKTPPFPPLPPSLDLSNLTSSSVLAKWAPNSLLSDRYLLQMRPVEAVSGDFQSVYAGNDRRFKLVRLKPRTGYAVRVSAANSSGEGPFSEQVSFCTLPQSPPSPRDLSAEWASERLLVSWKAQLSDAYTYALQFRELGKEFRTIHEGNACKCILNCQMNSFDIRVVTKLNLTTKLDPNWPEHIESNPGGILTVVKPKQELVNSVKKSEKIYEKKDTIKEPIVEEMPSSKETNRLPIWISQTLNNPYIWIAVMIFFTLILSIALPFFVRFN